MRSVRFLTSVLLAMAAGVAAGLACAPPSPPPPKGAVVPADVVFDVAFASLDDAVAVHDVIAGAGLIGTKVGQLSRSGLEAAGLGPPLVAASRENGGVFLSGVLHDVVRFNAAVALVLPETGWRRRRVLGQVDALDDADGNTKALLRAGGGVVVVVVDPVDVLAESALVEALCSGGLAPLTRTPTGTTVTVQPVGPLKGIIDGPLAGTLTSSGSTLTLSSSATLSGTPEAQALSQSLRSQPSAQACVAEDGAIVVAHIPAVGAFKDAAVDLTDVSVGAAVDAFAGRLTIALRPAPAGTPYDPNDLATVASLVVVGTPRPGVGAEALRKSVADAIAGAPTQEKVVGTRTVRTLGQGAGRPWRQVAVVTDDDVFAFGLGDVAVVDRVAADPVCAASHRLLLADGVALAQLVSRARPDLALLRKVAAMTGADDPLGMLAGVGRAELDASSTPAGAGGRLDLRLALTLVRRAK